MKAKYLAVVAALAVMLVAATAFATTDSAFAGKKGYSKSQALSQATSCGNGFISVADFCQDIGAQNQGKENSVAQSGNQEINIDISERSPPIICPADTVWDITLREAAPPGVGDLPAGTILCLPNGFGEQQATISGTDDTVGVDVEAVCDVGATPAEVTSGNPPTPVAIGDTVCVQFA